MKITPIIYANFFQSIWESFNSFLDRTLKFNELLDFIVTYIKDLPELLKWGGALFLAIIIILGLFSFIKKMFKLFIVLAVIGAIILVIWLT